MSFLVLDGVPGALPVPDDIFGASAKLFANLSQTLHLTRRISKLGFDRELISNGNPMEAVVGFSRAVRVGPFISVGGTAPVDADGKTVGVGDVAAQTRQCIEVIKCALEQAGSGLHDVVRTRVILTNIDDWKAAIDVRKEYFREVRPVDTIMAVDRFVNPEWLVELEADAIIAGWES